MHVTGFYLLCCLCLCAPALLCSGSPLHEEAGLENAGQEHHRQRRSAPSLSSRTHCNPGDEWPPTRVNTTQRLADLRAEMQKGPSPVDAFIVLSNDAHGSEYPSDHDLRRGYISGFKGSAGSAVVTLTSAALWTDGRYFLEAEDALDCNWVFMRAGEAGVPNIAQWLISVLDPGSIVGADPFLVSNSFWTAVESNLAKANISMIPKIPNPLDESWTDQPPPPMTPVNALEMEYAGKTWQDKIADLHQAMEDKGVFGAHIVTSLDENAWLFNLRASDISYNPFFISYAIVEYYGASNATNRIRLYIYNHTERLTADPSDPATENKLYEHLNTGMNGTCPPGQTDLCVEVLNYNATQVVQDVETITRDYPNSKIWITYVCNYAIYNSIPEDQRVQARSSIALAKAQKNEVERQGMENCYNRDSAVLVEFLAMLEKEVKEGRNWTEVSAAKRLKEMRLAANLNRGLSFGSISGSGPNGAVIHYSPSPLTDRRLTTDEMYLLDSGGQYLMVCQPIGKPFALHHIIGVIPDGSLQAYAKSLCAGTVPKCVDGTTDVTRTMHYGTPTDYMIECYTRVLMGATDLALVVWPEGVYGREIDMAARAPLWAVGLEYRHGTGHGIGAYLSVHEGPGRISMTHAANPSEETLHAYMYFSDGPGFISLSKSAFYSQEVLLPYMYFSDEPGFYEDGEFGIRLETIVMVEPTNTTHKFGTKQFLRFKPITLVPFEPNLIDYDLLSERQIDWLNSYHKMTKEVIEPLLTTDLARDWLERKTKPYTRETGTTTKPSTPTSSGTRPCLTLATVVMAITAALALLL